MQHNKRNVPDWLLERLALGELDAETAADVRRRLAAEGRSPDDITRGGRGVEPRDPGRASRQRRPRRRFAGAPPTLRPRRGPHRGGHSCGSRRSRSRELRRRY